MSKLFPKSEAKLKLTICYHTLQELCEADVILVTAFQLKAVFLLAKYSTSFDKHELCGTYISYVNFDFYLVSLHVSSFIYKLIFKIKKSNIDMAPQIDNK